MHLNEAEQAGGCLAYLLKEGDDLHDRNRKRFFHSQESGL